MRNKENWLIINLVLIFWLSAFSLPALMVEIPLEQLTAEANLIVQGRVHKIWSAWSDDHSLIYTYVIVEIDDLIKGEKVPQEEVTFRFRGGQVDDIGLALSDMPHFQVGEKVILFLTKAQEWQLVGNYQGKFAIETDKLTWEEIVTQEGAPLSQRLSSRLDTATSKYGRVYLTSFKRIVREIVREGR